MWVPETPITSQCLALWLITTFQSSLLETLYSPLKEEPSILAVNKPLSLVLLHRGPYLCSQQLLTSEMFVEVSGPASQSEFLMKSLGENIKLNHTKLPFL
jgi:hypothetical protein